MLLNISLIVCLLCIVGAHLKLDMHVFGTETHMTAVVGMALGKRDIPTASAYDSNDAANMFFNAQNNMVN